MRFGSKTKRRKSSWRLLHVLLFLLPLFVTACKTTSSENLVTAMQSSVPPMPKAGPGVKAELDRVCPIIRNSDGIEVSSCPAIDAWISRLFVFSKQLEVMQ